MEANIAKVQSIIGMPLIDITLTAENTARIGLDPKAVSQLPIGKSISEINLDEISGHIEGLQFLAENTKPGNLGAIDHYSGSSGGFPRRSTTSTETVFYIGKKGLFVEKSRYGRPSLAIDVKRSRNPITHKLERIVIEKGKSGYVRDWYKIKDIEKSVVKIGIPTHSSMDLPGCSDHGPSIMHRMESWDGTANITLDSNYLKEEYAVALDDLATRQKSISVTLPRAYMINLKPDILKETNIPVMWTVNKHKKVQNPKYDEKNKDNYASKYNWENITPLQVKRKLIGEARETIFKQIKTQFLLNKVSKALEFAAKPIKLKDWYIRHKDGKEIEHGVCNDVYLDIRSIYSTLNQIKMFENRPNKKEVHPKFQGKTEEHVSRVFSNNQAGGAHSPFYYYFIIPPNGNTNGEIWLQPRFKFRKKEKTEWCNQALRNLADKVMPERFPADI
jgi:hypothetical protein